MGILSTFLYRELKGVKVQKISTDFNVQIKFPGKATDSGEPTSVSMSSNPNMICITGNQESCEGASNALLELVLSTPELSATCPFTPSKDQKVEIDKKRKKQTFAKKGKHLKSENNSGPGRSRKISPAGEYEEEAKSDVNQNVNYAGLTGKKRKKSNIRLVESCQDSFPPHKKSNTRKSRTDQQTLSAKMDELSSGVIPGSSHAKFGRAEADLELPGLGSSWVDMEVEHREKREQYSREQENSFRQDLSKKRSQDESFHDEFFQDEVLPDMFYDKQSQYIDHRDHGALFASGEPDDLPIGNRGQNLVVASNEAHPAGPHPKRSGRAYHQDDGLQARTKPTQIRSRFRNKKVGLHPKEAASDGDQKCVLGVTEKVISETKQSRKSQKTTSKTKPKACAMDVKFIEMSARFVKEVIKDIGTTANFVKSDVYHVISEKELKLDEILKLPTKSEVEKERELAALDEDIRKSADEVRNKNEAFNAFKKLRKEREEARRKRFEENGKKRKQFHSELTKSLILESLQRHKQLLIGVKSGLIFSGRHEAYNKGGEAHWLLNERVFDGMVKDEDLEFILDQIDNITATDSMQKIISSDYNFKVLLPTFLVQVSLQ